MPDATASSWFTRSRLSIDRLVGVVAVLRLLVQTLYILAGLWWSVTAGNAIGLILALILTAVSTGLFMLLIGRSPVWLAIGWAAIDAAFLISAVGLGVLPVDIALRLGILAGACAGLVSTMWGGLATLVVVYAGILAAANPLPTLPELVPPIIGGLLLTGLVTFGADFLKRERQSADILRQEAVAVLNSTRDALVVTDPNNRVVSANRAALELAGAASIDEFRSTPLIDLFKRTFEDDGTLTRIAEHYATPDRLHEPFHATLQCRPPLVGFWEIEGRLMTGDQPETRLLWMLRDVTSERIRQQERADLVQMAVHELRSPMTSVSVVAGLASTGELDLTDAERRSYFLGVIETNSRRLMTLVEDLLTLSRIEAPDFQIAPTTQDLRDIAADAVARLRPQIEAAGHRLETVYQSDPVTVSADAAWLGIVVDNLLSNAIKYTPAGGGLLVVVEQKDGHGQLDVSDTGIGMSEAEQARLFDRFFRARNATSSEIPGSGLGLPIARQIVRLHGGDIHVVSAPGAGSTFTVQLPLA